MTQATNYNLNPGSLENEDYKQALDGLLLAIEEKRVLAEDSNQEEGQLHALLREQAYRESWSSADFARTRQAYVTKYSSEPALGTRHQWVNTFASRAHEATTAGDDAAAQDSITKGHKALKIIGEQQLWSKKQLAKNVASFNDLVQQGYITEAIPQLSPRKKAQHQKQSQALLLELANQQATVQSLRVRGLNTDSERPRAFALLGRYGQLQQWTAEQYNSEYYKLGQHLDGELTTDTYLRALDRFMAEAQRYKQKGNQVGLASATEAALLCQQQLGLSHRWSSDAIKAKQAELTAWIEAAPAKKANPGRQLSDWLGAKTMNVMGLAGERVAARGEQSPAAGTEDNEATSKFNRKGVVAGVIVGTIGAVALARGVELFGWGATAHHHLSDAMSTNPMHRHSGASPSLQPTKAPHSSHAVTVAPASPTPKASTTSIPVHHAPVHKTPVASVPHRPRHRQIITKSAQHVERLRFHNDSIWLHARHHLGKQATEGQVSSYVKKTLKLNHIPQSKTRFLPIGFKFRLP